MPTYTCKAEVISIVTAHVEAKSLDEAREKFKNRYPADDVDWDEDGGEVQAVNCKLSTIKLED